MLKVPTAPRPRCGRRWQRSRARRPGSFAVPVVLAAARSLGASLGRLKPDLDIHPDKLRTPTACPVLRHVHLPEHGGQPFGCLGTFGGRAHEPDLHSPASRSGAVSLRVARAAVAAWRARSARSGSLARVSAMRSSRSALAAW